MTLTPIYQISMTALGQWINNRHKRLFRKDRAFTLFDFISSTHQQLVFFSSRKSLLSHSESRNYFAPSLIKIKPAFFKSVFVSCYFIDVNGAGSLSAAATYQSLDTRRAPHKYAVTRANW